MTHGILPGDQLWTRDSWGIPMRVTVDFIDKNTGLIVGASNRLTVVRGLSGAFAESLARLVNPIGRDE